MKKSVSRDIKLPAFIIDLADLEALLSRLIPLIPESKYSTGADCLSVRVETSAAKYQFDNIEELRSYEELPERIDKWNVELSHGVGRVEFGSLYSAAFSRAATASASGDSEAWAAGAMETISTFFAAKKKWYGFMFRMSSSLALVTWGAGFVGIVSVMRKNAPHYVNGNVDHLASIWVAVMVALIVIALTKTYLLKPALLIRATRKSRLREYVPEMTLVAGIGALIISLFNIFSTNG